MIRILSIAALVVLFLAAPTLAVDPPPPMDSQQVAFIEKPGDCPNGICGTRGGGKLRAMVGKTGKAVKKQTRRIFHRRGA